MSVSVMFPSVDGYTTEEKDQIYKLRDLIAQTVTAKCNYRDTQNGSISALNKATPLLLESIKTEVSRILENAADLPMSVKVFLRLPKNTSIEIQVLMKGEKPVLEII